MSGLQQRGGNITEVVYDDVSDGSNRYKGSTVPAKQKKSNINKTIVQGNVVRAVPVIDKQNEEQDIKTLSAERDNWLIIYSDLYHGSYKTLNERLERMQTMVNHDIPEHEHSIVSVTNFITIIGDSICNLLTRFGTFIGTIKDSIPFFSDKKTVHTQQNLVIENNTTEQQPSIDDKGKDLIISPAAIRVSGNDADTIHNEITDIRTRIDALIANCHGKISQLESLTKVAVEKLNNTEKMLRNAHQTLDKFSMHYKAVFIPQNRRNKEKAAEEVHIPMNSPRDSILIRHPLPIEIGR